MSVYYTGEVDLQCRRHGKGQYAYPNRVFRFNGSWFDGFKHGEGTFIVEGGSKFSGRFVNGEIEGPGRKSWPDGRLYEGNFVRGEASGKGTFTSPTGESYVGNWALNRRHGHGELVLPHGQGTYVGEFAHHRFHGEGQLVLNTGFQYTGRFSQGRPHGVGSALYPRGSTFNGPYEAGLKSGCGGVYVCGITGITFSGEWKEGSVASHPSKLLVEVDALAEDGCDQVKSKPPAGVKGGKGGRGEAKGKSPPSGGKQQAAEEEDMDKVGREQPLGVKFDRDGKVVGLCCRCVRDVQVAVKVEQPLDTSDDWNGSKSRWTSWPPRVVVSEESGRTLAVTLHQIAPGSSPLELGPPTSFFVRRPNATDVSESLGRFPSDNLVAFYPLDKRCWPNGCHGRLGIDVPGELLDPMRGSEFDESALEARWQSIIGDLGSNRCLVLAAGQGQSLNVLGIFTMHRRSSNSWARDAVNTAGGQTTHEAGNAEGAAAKKMQQLHTITQSSPFTLCIDFRLDLDLNALAREDDGTYERSGKGHDGSRMERKVRIVTCGKYVEIYAILRLWTPPPPAPSVSNVADAVEVPASVGYPVADIASLRRRVSTGGGRTFAATGDSDDVPCSTWYLHAISARSGSRAVTLLCASPNHIGARRRGSLAQREFSVGTEQGKENEEAYDMAEEIVCDSGAWHSFAVNGSSDQAFLCVNGDSFLLQQTASTEADGSLFDITSRSPDDCEVIIGGAGGKWATLGVKNLAVYNGHLEDGQVGPMTCVYKKWREDGQIAAAAEARLAKEEEKEAAERPERLRGTFPITTMYRTTVRGEAKVDRIIVPKVVGEGEGWVLRVADVSGTVGKSTADGTSFADEIQTTLAADEERSAFPPLPSEIVRLELAC